MTMSEYSNSIYADYGKIVRGMRMYFKISQPAMYATIKLIQFIARGVKAKFFDKDITENFTKFLKETGGDYSIFRVPFKESDTREAAIGNIKNYLDKAGVKYCILESVNDEDKAVHVSIARKDEQKFNVMFTDYIKANLTSDKELNSNDLINLTNGKTTIVSVPDAALDVMKNALTETKVNFAELPDLIPDDGEKQLRVATADLNTTKQCYESYKHSLIKNASADVTESVTNVPDMKIYSEDDYLNTARRSPDEYMESASDEIKAHIAEFEQLEATEAEKAMQKWDMEIQDSKNVNCQALRGNMAFSEISIDKETLVDRNNINAQLEQRFPNFFFCTVPGTKGEQTLMLPKNQVFTVNDADKARYVAFVNNQKPVKLWVKGEPDGGTTYKTGKELFEKFDKHDNNAELTRNISKALEAAPVPKAAPVK